MRIKLGVGVALAAVAVAGAGVAMQAVSATAASHTIHLTAVQLKSTQIRSNSFVQAEKDLENAKVTGYDAVTCTFNTTSQKAACDGSFARGGGELYVHATVLPTGHGNGHVTGGTGTYKGATGTISLAPGATENQTRITITYVG